MRKTWWDTLLSTGFIWTTFKDKSYLTLTMAASREQSGSPGLSIIPAVRYAMLSITKALRAIIANFSYSSRAKTHTLVTSDLTEKGWLFILLLGKSQVYLNHTELRQTFIKLLSGCSVFCGQFWKKKHMEMIMSDWRRFIISHMLLSSQLFIFFTDQFFNHSSRGTAHTEPPRVKDVHGNLSKAEQMFGSQFNIILHICSCTKG